MPNYNPPSMRNIPFSFGTGGYQKPDFSSVPFRFGLRPSYQQTADLQAAINVIGQDYLKECPTIIVGYGPYGPQILQLPCIYAGIRNLGAILQTVSPNVDLPAYLNAVANFKDLNGYIKIVTEENKDLPASTYGIPPVDLPAVILVNRIRNLGVYITGGWPQSQKDLSAYTYGIPPSDLQARIDAVGPVDLPAIISGFAIGILSASITGMSYRNLNALLQPLRVKYLQAIINSIDPIDLSASIHGWATKDLPTYLNGVYGPYDIQAALIAIPPKDLSAYIRGYKGIKIPFDLRAVVESYYAGNLQGIINIISAVDLLAYLNPTGQSSDLGGSIVPRIIALRKALQVSLLEHKNLIAMINFQCFSSGYSDLSAYTYALMKKDMRAYIVGVGPGANFADLGSYINVDDYRVQDAHIIDIFSSPSKYTRLKVKFFVDSRSDDKYVRLKLNMSIKDSYIVFDTHDVLFTSFPAPSGPAFSGTYNITSSITSISVASSLADLRSYIKIVEFGVAANLGASLTPVFDANYTELLPLIAPKTHEVVINLERFEEQWRKFVEIMFDNTGEGDYHYFYVSGSQKTYRVERDRHWTLWVKSYIEDDESIIDRRAVRDKYIFNLSNYSTIDEAVRDMIDRFMPSATVVRLG